MPSRTISSRATTSAWTSMGSNSTPQDDKSSFVLAQDDQPGRVYRRAFIACHYTRRPMTTRRPLVVKNRFVMGCWTPAELRWRLRRAGFARVHVIPATRVGLPDDRLFAIATR